MAQWNKYEASKARAQGRPGRELRPKIITVDFHSHVGVPEAAELVKPHLDAQSNPLARFADAATRALNQQQEADIKARGGLDKRLADLDAMGVDMQVIMPPPPQCYYAVPLDIAVKATEVVNDGIAAFVAQRPDRLRGFGSVPMLNGNEAAKELERCVTKLDFKGCTGAHQRQRQGVVGPGLRTLLEEGRGAGRAGRHPLSAVSTHRTV